MTLLDVDADGQLDAAEIEAAPARLRLADENADGTLSRDEILAQRAPRGGRILFDPVAFIKRVMGHDRNGDGRTTAAELPEGLKRLIPQADTKDTNRDGALSRLELEARMRSLQRRLRRG